MKKKIKMMISIRCFLTGIILLLGFSIALSQEAEIPKDTSYNVNRVYQKTKRNYPEVQIASADLPNGVIADYDLTYLTIPDTPYGNRILKADVFRPEKKGEYPAIVMIHGGGWRSGNKSMQRALAVRLAERGFVTICPEYQLSQEVLYPTALFNIKACIRWARANADKYSIDTNKMVTSGGSAGGQLALLTGLTSGVGEKEGRLGDFSCSSNIQAIIDIDGVVDFMSPLSLKSNRAGETSATDNEWLHGSFYDNVKIWKDASPIFWADENSPPMLFIKSGFPRFTAGLGELISLLDIWGIYYEVYKFDVQVHPFWLLDPWVEPTVDYMEDFLNKVFE